MTRPLFSRLLETACLIAFWPMAMMFSILSLMASVTLDFARHVLDVWIDK